MQCDCCDEDWEEAFFCKKCSGPDMVDDYEDDPLDYSDSPRQNLVVREVWTNVCGNCCTCHLLPAQSEEGTQK